LFSFLVGFGLLLPVTAAITSPLAAKSSCFFSISGADFVALELHDRGAGLS